LFGTRARHTVELMARWVSARVAAAASLWLPVALGAFDKLRCQSACDAARSDCSSHISFLTGASADINHNHIHSLCDNTVCLNSVKSLSTACTGYQAELGSMSDGEKAELKLLNAISLTDICLSNCARRIMALPAPDKCIRTLACPAPPAQCDYLRPPTGNETREELTEVQIYNRLIPCSRIRNIDIEDGKIKSCQEFFCDVRKHCGTGTPSLDIQYMTGSSPMGGMIRASLLVNISQTYELLSTAFDNCTMKPLQCLACFSTMPTLVLLLAVAFICNFLAFNLP